MNKFYIVIVDTLINRESAVIDLNALPKGSNSNLVTNPWTQGQQIGKWLLSDPQRGIRILGNIKSNNFDTETLDFVSNIASFWENLPPADEEKSGVLLAAPAKVDFIRTSDEVAFKTWDGARSMPLPKPKRG